MTNMTNKAKSWKYVIFILTGLIGCLGFAPSLQAQIKTTTTTTTTKTADDSLRTEPTPDILVPSTNLSTSTTTAPAPTNTTIANATETTSSSDLQSQTVLETTDFDATVFFRGSGFNLGTTQTNQARRLKAIGLYNANETLCNTANITNQNGHPSASLHSGVNGHLQVTDNVPALDGFKWKVLSTGLIYNKNTFWTRHGAQYSIIDNSPTSGSISLDFIPPEVSRDNLVFLPVLRGYSIQGIGSNGIGVKTLSFNVSHTLSADRQTLTLNVTPTVMSFEGARTYNATVYYDIIVYDPTYWGHKGFSWVSAYNDAVNAGNSSPITTNGSGDTTDRVLEQTLDLGLPLAAKEQAFTGFYKYGYNTSSTTPFEFDAFQARAIVKSVDGNKVTVQMAGAVYGHQGAFYTDPEKVLNPTELKGYVIYCKDPAVCRASTAATGTGSANWASEDYVHDDLDVLLPVEGDCQYNDQLFNVTIAAANLATTADASDTEPTSSPTLTATVDTATKTTTDKADTETTPTREITITTVEETKTTTDTDSTPILTATVDTATKTTTDKADTETTPTREITITKVDDTVSGEPSDGGVATETTAPKTTEAIEKDPSLLDKILDFFDSEKDTETTDSTASDTTDETTPPVEPVVTGGRFLIANENSDNGTNVRGISEHDSSGAHVASYLRSLDSTLTHMESMSGLAQLGGTVYASGEHLYRMGDDGFRRFDLPGYNATSENVNALCTYKNKLVIVGSAGSWIHFYDPATGTLDQNIASGFENPQGCKQVGDDLFVIGTHAIYRVFPGTDCHFNSELYFDLGSVSRDHFSEGTLEAFSDYLFYTNHAPDYQSGHLVAVDRRNKTGRIVASVTSNPRGLAIDPDKQYIYVSQLTGAGVVRFSLRQVMAYLENMVQTQPQAEQFITDAVNLAGPFGILWVHSSTSDERVPQCDPENDVETTPTTPGEDVTDQDGPPDLTHVDSTDNEDCKDGLHLVDGHCIPNETVTPTPDGTNNTDTPTDLTHGDSTNNEDCKEGLHLVDGNCVPNETVKTGTCPEGTHPENGACVPDDTKTDDTNNTDPICPNGILETGEECEIGQEEDGDPIYIGFDPAKETCSQDCRKHTLITSDSGNKQNCGNGILEGTEQCEKPNLGFNPELQNCEQCLVTRKTGDTSINPPVENDPLKPAAQCGNGKLEEGEQCDGRQGLNSADEFCSLDCKISKEVSDPREMEPVCGNDKHEIGEQCDGPGSYDPEFQTCEKCLIRTIDADRVINDDVDELDDSDEEYLVEHDLDESDENAKESDDDYGDDSYSDDNEIDEMGGISSLALCGNGELDTGEECDPAHTLAEGLGSSIRICNYRCQYITLVLSCCPDCEDHEQHQHDLPPQKSTSGDEPTQPQDLSSGNNIDSTQPVTGISGTTSQNQSSSTQNQASPNPWGGYGLSGGGCQLSTTTTEASRFAPVLFGLSLLFAVLLRRRAKRLSSPPA